MSRRVLFLDVDGVLNSERWFAQEMRGNLLELDPAAVGMVQAIVHATGAEIVLSSTWRLVPDLRQQIQAVLPHTERTPRGSAFDRRSQEIRAWLDAHPDVTAFAILDDDADAGYDGLDAHFVQTDPKEGIRSADVVRVVKLLQES